MNKSPEQNQYCHFLPFLCRNTQKSLKNTPKQRQTLYLNIKLSVHEFRIPKLSSFIWQFTQIGAILR